MTYFENPGDSGNDNGQQPINEGQQPVNEGQQSVNEGQQPVNSEQPINEGQQPVNSEQQPVNSEQPINEGQQPVNGEQQPVNGQQPAGGQSGELPTGGQPYYGGPDYQPGGGFTPPQQPKKPGLSGGTKVFITVMAVLCCLTVVISSVFIASSLSGNGGTASSAAASSKVTTSSGTVSAPGLTVDDLVMLEDGSNLSPRAAYQKVSVSVVSIQTYVNSSLDVYAEGSGFYFKQLSDGALVVTCAHVVSDCNSVKVIDSAGNSYDAAIVAMDSNTDLAVLKVSTTGVTPVEFGNGNNTEIGSFVMAIGNPTGEQLASSLTFGVLSGKQRIYQSDSYNSLLQFDAAVNPGNSGGPLINMYGQVIGVVSSKIASVDYEGIGFAIPSDEAIPIIEDLCEYGYVRGRVRLGVSIEQYQDNVVTAQNLPGCVAVYSVVDGTDAAAKGIKTGDIIVSIDGTAVTSSDQLIEIVRAHSPGDKVTLQLYRKSAGVSQTLTVTVQLYEYYGETDS